MFQSTPPRGGATPPGSSRPCQYGVSIHAPTWGGDPDGVPPMATMTLFQSTPPVSIHAPTWGGDSICSPFQLTRKSFNPRPHVGGRRRVEVRGEIVCPFQSTPPRGGATVLNPRAVGQYGVSIHAPTWGGDVGKLHEVRQLLQFQSTPPRGGATVCSGPS